MSYYLRNLGDILRDGSITAPTFTASQGFYGNVVAEDVRTDELTTLQTAGIQDLAACTAVIGTLTVGSSMVGSSTGGAIFGNLEGNLHGYQANVENLIATNARVAGSLTVGSTTGVAGSIAVPSVYGNLYGNVTGTAATVGSLDASSARIGDLSAGVLNASQINLPTDSGSVIQGRVGMRTDVMTGLVVDGNAFVYNGGFHGDGTGLSGFESKGCASLEDRLATFASSDRRLYVSTRGKDTNLGTSRDQAFRTIKKAAARAVTGTVIWVEAGVYTEDNPIYVPPNVAIIGDSLRNTLLTAANPQLDYFHAGNMTYFSQLRFVDLRSPGFCVAFPCSLAQVEVTDAGRIQPPNLPNSARVPVIYSPQAPTGYYLEAQPPTTNAASDATVVGIIHALLDGIANVVATNPGTPFDEAATSNAGGHTRAAALLRGNLAFFKAEMMEWISGNPAPPATPIANRLTADQRALCARDVGYLVEAVAQDLTAGRAVNSVAAAAAYYKGTTSVLSNAAPLTDHRSTTADAIRFLRDRAKAVGVETVVTQPLQTDVLQEKFAFSGTEASLLDGEDIAAAKTRVTALLAGFAAIVAGDMLAEFDPAAMSMENGAGCRRVARVLRESRTLLQDDVVAWVDLNITQQLAGYTLSAENKAKCRRDVGFILDALDFDLQNGSSLRTREYALKYYVGAQSVLSRTAEQTKTAEAIMYLGERIVARVDAETDPRNVFDKNGTTRYESLLTYKNYNGTADASGVTVQVDLPGPVMYVAYRLKNTNLKKWRLEGRQTDGADWETLDVQSGIAAATRRMKALVEGFAGIVEGKTPEAAFGPAALSTEKGAGIRIARVLRESRTLLQDEVMAWVDRTIPRLSSDRKAKCRRDVGFILDALDYDLQNGSNVRTLEYAGKYYVNAQSVLPADQKKPTADAIRYLGERIAALVGYDEPNVAAASPSDTETAVARATGLVEGLANRVVSLTGVFPRDAVENTGGHTRASTAVRANAAFLQAEIMAWVSSNVNLSDGQKESCKRDVGYIATAIAGDLRAGGITRTLEAAGLYYDGATSRLSPGTEVPTANAIRRIGELLAHIIRNEPVPASLRLQTQVSQAFDDTGGDETVTTYPTSALTGYSSYRLVMLQTQEAGATFKLGSIEFLDVQLPTAVSDGPSLSNTVVADFEIVDPGTGYETAPTITVRKADGTDPDEFALATATIDNVGSLASVTLQPRTFTSVQRLTLTNPGKGYVTAPAVTFTTPPGGAGSGAEARTWIDRRGRIVRLELVAGGSGYTVAPTVTFGAPPPGGEAATASASITGVSSEAWSMARGRGYDGAAKVIVGAPSGPDGRQAVVQAIMGDDYAELHVPLYDTVMRRNVDESGRLVSVRLLHPGSGYKDDNGYADPPVISITPPEGLRPVIVGSPYVQNCTNVSGPWDTKGEKVPVTWPLPWKPENIYNVPNQVGYDATKPSDRDKGLRILDNSGAGGGIRIDGRCCHPFSPLRSFVVDAFTQVNQGGIGFLLTNLAYAQFVSTFGTFCNIHALSISGSFANFSNSVTDFGRRGLVARGYYREPYLVGQVQALPGGWTEEEYDQYKYVPGVGYSCPVAEIQFATPGLRGKGYTPPPAVPPAVTITAPLSGTGQGAQATATVSSDGTLGSIVTSVKGRGYRFPPTVSIAAPPGWTEADQTNPTSTKVRAEARAVLTGVSKVRVTITGGTPLRFANNRRPDALSIVRVHGRFYTVSGAAEVSQNTYDVSFGGSEGAPPYIDVGHEVEFFQTSYISTGGHVFEYVGDNARGCTYNSLPEYGGVADSTFEIVRTSPAKVFFTSSDHLGNQKIGDFFSVNQATGAVKLDAKNFDLSRISTLGPFIREGVAQGVALREVSASTNLVSSTGAPDGATVPTQTAVKTYVDKQAVPIGSAGGQVGAFLRWTGDGLGYEWKQFTVENLPVASREKLGIIRAGVRCDVVSGLVADGDARIFGSVNAEGDAVVAGKVVANAGLELTFPPDSHVPPLDSNRTMTFDLVDDTTLKINVRGSDGQVRSSTISLSPPAP